MKLQLGLVIYITHRIKHTCQSQLLRVNTCKFLFAVNKNSSETEVQRAWCCGVKMPVVYCESTVEYLYNEILY